MSHISARWIRAQPKSCAISRCHLAGHWAHDHSGYLPLDRTFARLERVFNHARAVCHRPGGLHNDNCRGSFQRVSSWSPGWQCQKKHRRKSRSRSSRQQWEGRSQGMSQEASRERCKNRNFYEIAKCLGKPISRVTSSQYRLLLHIFKAP